MTAGYKQNQFKIRDEPFARGGEGCVHDVEGHPDLVAKIYHPAGRTRVRENKIKAMLKSPPGGSTNSQIAWPTEILYEFATGKFLGFVMPRIRNVSKIDELYSYDKRDHHKWKWYIQAAQNLCAAVFSVHKSGHVIGDLNPANICVDPVTALVTLVDTDSYSIKAKDGTFYPCTVCRPEYVPAELLNLVNKNIDLKKAKGPTFTVYTDRFALGVHVFALLMNGCHPHACTVENDALYAQYNLQKNIENGYFPFWGKASGVGVPRYAPPLSILPEILRNLAMQTFSTGSAKPSLRAKPEEWFDALDELERSLTQCKKSGAHQYWSQLSACPLCAARAEIDSVLTRHKTSAIVTKTGTSAATKTTARTTTTTATQAVTTQTTAKTSAKTSGSGGANKWKIPSVVNVVIKCVIAAVIWLGWNFLANWLLLKVPLSAWWWTIIRYLCLGIIPYVPMWIFGFISDISSAYWPDDMVDIYSVATRWAVLVVYGGVAIIAGIGKGWFNLIAWTILICLPSELMCRFFPDATIDYW